MERATGNIILTGFMGTGKSTVGRIIADRLGLAFVDTDAVIERDHGPIREIFASSGESRFRELERTLLADLSARAETMVIATGGGMAIDPENAATLESMGPVFALTAEPDEIVRRVEAEGLDERTLLAQADPARRVEQILGERAAIYARFVSVSTDGRTPESVADEIIAELDASS